VSGTGNGEMQTERYLKKRDQSKLLGKNNRIIIKYILKAKNGSVRIMTSGGLL
jgi:hypothetical protein